MSIGRLAQPPAIGCWQAEDAGSGWPIEPLAVFGTFDYVGPYFVSAQHGPTTHGPATHGYGPNGWFPSDHCFSPLGVARAACLNAIRSCDVFYAWLDDLTAYGTLVEIGYAEAFGKAIIIDGPAARVGDDERNELWFAASAGSNWQSYGTTAVESVRNYVAEWSRKNPRLESEIEYLFWDAWQAWDAWDVRLTPSLPVHGADGKNYRLDFACEDLRVAIELDGHKYHSGPDVFVRDRARQRALTAVGWTFIRYAGREIMNSPSDCARDTYAFLRSMRKATPTA